MTTTSDATADQPPLATLAGRLTDLGVAIVGLGLAGALGGVIWSWLAHPPVYVRTAQGAEMDQLQLTGLFSIVGSYFMIAVVVGLVAGAALMIWRWREPVWVLVCALVGSALAAWMMLAIGQTLGPGDPAAKLRHAAVGTSAAVQLTLARHAFHIAGLVISVPIATLAWPIGVSLGMIVVLLLIVPRRLRGGPDSTSGQGRESRAGESHQIGRGEGDLGTPLPGGDTHRGEPLG